MNKVSFFLAIIYLSSLFYNAVQSSDLKGLQLYKPLSDLHKKEYAIGAIRGLVWVKRTQVPGSSFAVYNISGIKSGTRHATIWGMYKNNYPDAGKKYDPDNQYKVTIDYLTTKINLLNSENVDLKNLLSSAIQISDNLVEEKDQLKKDYESLQCINNQLTSQLKTEQNGSLYLLGLKNSDESTVTEIIGKLAADLVEKNNLLTQTLNKFIETTLELDRAKEALKAQTDLFSQYCAK